MDKEIKQRFSGEIKASVLSRYDLDESKVNAPDGFESFIFDCGRTSFSGEDDVILRIGHSGRRNVDLVNGEIDFINFLSDKGMNVARAIPSPSGNLIETINDGYGQEFIAVTFKKMAGKPSGASPLTENQIIHYGEFIGRTHALTKLYSPSSPGCFRPQWNDPIMHEVEENLTADHQYAIDKYRQCCETMATFSKDSNAYGLVHFDAHQGNFLMDESGQIGLFDFDDAHYTWFANDIAIVLFYMQNGPADNSFTKFFMTHFLKGYTRENALDPVWLETIPLFMKVREIDLFALVHRSFDVNNLNPDDPGDAWCIRFLKNATPRIQNDVPVVDFDFTQLKNNI